MTLCGIILSALLVGLLVFLPFYGAGLLCIWGGKELKAKAASMIRESKRLVIAETRTSTWHYHLRELAPEEEPKLGGLPSGTQALCGNPNLGWDVLIPLTAWGIQDKTSHWCSACEAISGKRPSEPALQGNRGA